MKRVGHVDIPTQPSGEAYGHTRTTHPWVMWVMWTYNHNPPVGRTCESQRVDKYFYAVDQSSKILNVKY